MTESMRAIRHLETAVRRVPHGPSTGEPEGLVLRYGILYGPGASDNLVAPVRKRRLPVIGGGTGVWSFTHVADAASATARAAERGRPGIYNVVDDDPAPVAEWLPYLAETPRRPAALAGAGRAGPAAGGRFGAVDDDRDPRLVQRPGPPRTRLGSPVRQLACGFAMACFRT